MPDDCSLFHLALPRNVRPRGCVLLETEALGRVRAILRESLPHSCHRHLQYLMVAYKHREPCMQTPSLLLHGVSY